MVQGTRYLAAHSFPAAGFDSTAACLTCQKLTSVTTNVMAAVRSTQSGVTDLLWYTYRHCQHQQSLLVALSCCAVHKFCIEYTQENWDATVTV